METLKYFKTVLTLRVNRLSYLTLYITSHLCTPPSLSPISSHHPGVFMVCLSGRQIAVRRVTMESTAFHASCHRCSSAAGRTSSGGAARGGGHAATDGWQTAWGSVTLAHSCLLSLLQSLRGVSFFVWRSARGIWDREGGAQIDNVEIEQQKICVVLRVKMMAWWDMNVWQMERFIFLGLKWQNQT